MRSGIIGTAGHVDHGKTALIHALTGIETDRLAEEKKRGITIELGFAYMDFDGGCAEIIDVPGHEKLIRTMLSGVGGIDCALLVIAADEGVMPQTREHLDILRLLKIPDGVVALTKIDLVTPERLAACEAETRRFLKGTFLENAPIVPVSARTGDGLPELRAALTEKILAIPPRDLSRPFRMPIDRVFSVEGFGTVVTGTLTDGVVSVDQEILLLPEDLPCRVRGLQVHGVPVETAFAGQRVAVNLAGCSREQVQKGNMLSVRGGETVTHMLDALCRILPDAGRSIRNNTQVHFYHGAAAAIARIILLDRDVLAPGESGFAQLRFSEELAVRKGDPFVLRFLSPVETIGGGVILDPLPERHKQHDGQTIRLLEIISGGDEQEEQAYRRECRYKLVSGRVLRLCASFHRDHPLCEGVNVFALKQKTGAADETLARMAGEGLISVRGKYYALPDFTIILTPRQEQIRKKILHFYKKGDLEPPNLDTVYGAFPAEWRSEVRMVMDSLIAGGKLTAVSRTILYQTKTLNAMLGHISRFFDENETMTIAQFKQVVPVSRKYAMAVLHYLEMDGCLKNTDGVRTRVRPILRR